MDKAILVIDMPDTCSDCYFCSNPTTVSVGNGLFKKISKCVLAKDDIEDPWRNIYWQMEHKEDWCPLKSAPKPINVNYGSDEQDWEKGYNACVEEILDI